MMHGYDVRIGRAAVRRLIADQFPQWSDLPIRSVVATGAAHAIDCIGEDLVARFPLPGQDPDETRRRLVAKGRRRPVNSCPVAPGAR